MDWEALPTLEVPARLPSVVGGHRLVWERLVRLGLETEPAWRAFLDPATGPSPSPFELPGVTLAVDCLARARTAGRPLLLWGAEDLDGLAATSLLLTGLRSAGIEVEVVIPVGTRDGRARAFGRLRDWMADRRGGVVTCGRGVLLREVVNEARAAEVDLVMLDPPEFSFSVEWEAAEVDTGIVVSAALLPSGHPMRGLTAAAMVYQLLRALIGSAPEWLAPESLLDLVALGLAGGDAELRDEARRLLWRGIRVIRRTERVGLRALRESVGLGEETLDEIDLAVGLGSRLSALAQLGDPVECVELLTTTDAIRAAELAAQCEGLHARRRQERQWIEASAAALLEKDPTLLGYAAIVLAHPDWTGRTTGTVAGWLAERYSRPVVLLGGSDTVLSGWARSGPHADLSQLLGGCRELLLRLGGGARAASLSLHHDQLFAFRRCLSRAVRGSAEQEPDPLPPPRLLLDGELTLAEITPELLADLARLAPFGQGNRRPVLASRQLRVVRHRQLGQRGQALELLLEASDGTRRRAFWWNGAFLPTPLPEKVDIAYHLRSRFRDGREEPVLELLDLLPTALPGEGAPSTEETPAVIIVDHRASPDPRAARDQLLALHPEAIVWREGESGREGEPGVSRGALAPAETLLVWTIPPGPEEWAAALAVVTPRRLLLFAQSPPHLTLPGFLQRLGGLINYALRHKAGRTSLLELASALAHREATVRQGLRWFAAGGQIGLEWGTRGELRLSRPVALPPGASETPTADDPLLAHLLAETEAWRRNWRQLVFE